VIGIPLNRREIRWGNPARIVGLFFVIPAMLVID